VIYISFEYVYSDVAMTVTTTVGPLKPDTRDRLAAYRDQNGHENYNEAIEALLNVSTADSSEVED
jgi:hypothetical protein